MGGLHPTPPVSPPSKDDIQCRRVFRENCLVEYKIVFLVGGEGGESMDLLGEKQPFK